MKNLFAFALVAGALALSACTTVESAPPPRTTTTTTEETTVHRPMAAPTQTQVTTY